MDAWERREAMYRATSRVGRRGNRQGEVRYDAFEEEARYDVSGEAWGAAQGRVAGVG